MEILESRKTGNKKNEEEEVELIHWYQATNFYLDAFKWGFIKSAHFCFICFVNMIYLIKYNTFNVFCNSSRLLQVDVIMSCGVMS